MNSALPMWWLDITPLPEPASSPVLILKFDPSMHTGFPSHFTFFVPLSVSDDIAMFG